MIVTDQDHASNRPVRLWEAGTAKRRDADDRFLPQSFQPRDRMARGEERMPDRSVYDAGPKFMGSHGAVVG